MSYYLYIYMSYYLPIAIYIYIYDNIISMTRKSGKHSHATYWRRYSYFDLLGLIGSVYCDLHHCRSNQQSRHVKPKLYHWCIYMCVAHLLMNVSACVFVYVRDKFLLSIGLHWYAFVLQAIFIVTLVSNFYSCYGLSYFKVEGSSWCNG